jgi:hypothetical protein
MLGGAGACARPVTPLVWVALGAAWACGCTSVDKSENVARNREDATLSGSTAATPGHLLAVVRLENGAFSVTQVTRVPGTVPAKRGDGGPAGWIVRAEDPSGSEVHGEAIADPQVIRAAFRDQNGETEGVQTVQSGPVTFAVRVPVGSKTVKFFRGVKPRGGAAQRTTAAPEVLLGQVVFPG